MVDILPVVDDAADLQPLRPDAVAVEALLQVLGGVFLFVVLLASVAAPIIQRRWLIHVILTDVVTVHRWMVHVQLKNEARIGSKMNSLRRL